MNERLSPNIETQGRETDLPTETDLLSSGEDDEDQSTVKGSTARHAFTSEERHMMRGWIRNEEKLSGRPVSGLDPWRRFIDTHRSTLRPIRTPASYYFYYRAHLELAPPIVPGRSRQKEKTEAEEYPLFYQGLNPMKFWIHPTAEVDITILAYKIQHHGGLAFDRDSQADFAVVRRAPNTLNKGEYNQLLKNCKGGIVDPHWIHNCIKQNKVLAIGPYRYPVAYVDDDEVLSDVISVPPEIASNPNKPKDSQMKTPPIRRRPYRPSYTTEERNLMAKIGRKALKRDQAFYPTSYETWGPYLELFPGRTYRALAHYALRHPSLFRDTSENDGQRMQKPPVVEVPLTLHHTKPSDASVRVGDLCPEPASNRARHVPSQQHPVTASSSTHQSVDKNSLHQRPPNALNEIHRPAFSVSTADFEILLGHILESRPHDSHDAISESLSALANSEKGCHHPDTWWLAVYYMNADLFRQLSHRLRFDMEVTSHLKRA